MKRLFFLLTCFLPHTGWAGDVWPGWRGPTGLGKSDEKDLPLKWGGTRNENIVWKSPLPGTLTRGRTDHNQSSPIVWKDRVFVTLAFWPEGVSQTQFPEHHVACYSSGDGKLIWDVKVPPGPWLLKDLRGGYGAPTPCTDGKLVYALFGSSELVALNFDGKLIWRTEIIPYAWDVAIGTSPVLTPESVLLLADGTNPMQSRLIALDPATGQVQWERKRPESNFNHSTPVLIQVEKKHQLVIASSEAIQGVDPKTGIPIWWVKNRGDVPTPAFGAGLVYSESGRGGPGIAVEPTGTGDISGSGVKWKTGPIPEGYSSPIIAGDFVYRLHTPGILKCFDVATGKPLYSERIPVGVNTSTSPILSGNGLLYFASGGKSMVVKVGSRFDLQGTSDLGDDCSSSPAVAHGRLFIKGARYLYCIGKP